MSRKLTQRGEERRAQILAFAVQRFAENGFHPTSVAEIVQGIGVGKGVFYWYFASKDELFLEILREAQMSMRRRQEQAIAGIGDPIRRIEEGIRATTVWSAENPDLFTLFQFAVTEDRFTPALRKGQSVAVHDIVHHLKDAVSTGAITLDADPEMLAHAVLGVTGQLVRIFVHERGLDPHPVADAAIELCLHGLLSRSPVTSS